MRETLRANTKAAAKSNPCLAKERLRVEDRQVKTKDGEEITVRLYRPVNLEAQKLPVCVLYVRLCPNTPHPRVSYRQDVDRAGNCLRSYHGGGFVLGDVDREDGSYS